MGSTPAAAEPAMREIVRSCSGLPLAIDIAAAHAVSRPRQRWTIWPRSCVPLVHPGPDHIARHTGRTERALHAYGQALTHFQAIGHANREADTWSKLGDIHAERGEDADAREAWTTALALHCRQGRSAAAHRMTTNLTTDGPDRPTAPRANTSRRQGN
ncbi:tetratricopeptide repeat protein [Streptomyces sp. AcE210]|uniref:tetratricopeptide repeat protein n=1 Tax=Streptomyces sp. AcE210 TaxID=2292703 RepID=UPI0010591DC1|nr:tetratricopeptide repeat protein [Streptomyces sp. AcE210]